MILLRRGKTGGVRRPGILTEGNVARAIRAYCAGTGRGRINVLRRGPKSRQVSELEFVIRLSERSG